MSDKLSNIVENLYAHFIIRDLTYVFGGAILLASIYYASGGNLKCGINYISEGFIKFLLFLVISYFMGLIAQEGLSLIRIVTTKVQVPEPYRYFQVIMPYIQKCFGPEGVRRIERIIYLKHVGSAIGASSFISSLVLLFPLIKNHRIWDVIAFIILVLFAIVGIGLNRRVSNLQNEVLNHFANRMQNNNMETERNQHIVE